MESTIIGVGNFPSIWPPLQHIEILRNAVEDHYLIISIDVNGRFIAELEKDSTILVKIIFNSIVVPPLVPYIFSICLSGEKINLHINGHEIPLDTGNQRKVMLAYDNVQAIKKEISIFNSSVIPCINPSLANSQSDHLFLSTLQDIDSKIIACDKYSLIRSSGLLRQIFIDGLLNTVNSKYKIKIAFKLLDSGGDMPVKSDKMIHWATLDPTDFPNARTIECNVNEFLNKPCLTMNNRKATVKDLIRACANAKGGVHLGRAKNTNEQSILDWDEAIQILGEEPSLLAIRDVCRISLQGFKGLVENIQKASF